MEDFQKKNVNNNRGRNSGANANRANSDRKIPSITTANSDEGNVSTSSSSDSEQGYSTTSSFWRGSVMLARGISSLLPFNNTLRKAKGESLLDCASVANEDYNLDALSTKDLIQFIKLWRNCTCLWHKWTRMHSPRRESLYGYQLLLLKLHEFDESIEFGHLKNIMYQLRCIYRKYSKRGRTIEVGAQNLDGNMRPNLKEQAKEKPKELNLARNGDIADQLFFLGYALDPRVPQPDQFLCSFCKTIYLSSLTLWTHMTTSHAPLVQVKHVNMLHRPEFLERKRSERFASTFSSRPMISTTTMKADSEPSTPATALKKTSFRLNESPTLMDEQLPRKSRSFRNLTEASRSFRQSSGFDSSDDFDNISHEDLADDEKTDAECALGLIDSHRSMPTSSPTTECAEISLTEVHKPRSPSSSNSHLLLIPSTSSGCASEMAGKSFLAEPSNPCAGNEPNGSSADDSDSEHGIALQAIDSKIVRRRRRNMGSKDEPARKQAKLLSNNSGSGTNILRMESLNGNKTKCVFLSEYDDNFLANFIRIYEQNECLWNQSSSAYRSPKLKSAAYNELLALYREANPNASMTQVKHLIRQLRSRYEFLQKANERRYRSHIWERLAFIESGRRSERVEGDSSSEEP